MIGLLLWLLSMSPRASEFFAPSAPAPAPAAPRRPKAPRVRPEPPPRSRPTPRAREPRASSAAKAERAQRAAQEAQAAQMAKQAAQDAAAKQARRRARRQAQEAAAQQAAAQQAAAASARPPRRRKKKKKATNRVTRANLVKIPGQWWVPWDPAPADLTAFAQQKLEELWQSGEGTTRVIPLDDGRIVGLLAIEVDGERGISIWKLRAGTVIPEGVFPPVEELEEMQAEAEAAVAPAPVEEVEDEDEDVQELEVEEVDDDEPQELLTHLPTLMQGNSGPDVVTLQKALGMTGQLGFFGPSTAQKVRAFQEAEGLEADGIVGPTTWTALLT